MILQYREGNLKKCSSRLELKKFVFDLMIITIMKLNHNIPVSAGLD